MNNRQLISKTPPPLAGLLLALVVATAPVALAALAAPASYLGGLAYDLENQFRNIGSLDNALGQSLILSYQTATTWQRGWNKISHLLPAEEASLILERNEQGIKVLSGEIKDNFTVKEGQFVQSVDTGAAVAVAAANVTAANVFTATQFTGQVVVGPGVHWFQASLSNLSGLWQSFVNAWRYYWSVVTGNWNKFLNAEEEQVPVMIPDLTTGLSDEERQQLKQEIQSSILKDINSMLANQGPMISPVNPSGLVVIPSTGDPNTDLLVKENVAGSFSDEVRVRFDATGNSGIITPIFRDRAGGDFLFILTPLRQ